MKKQKKPKNQRSKTNKLRIDDGESNSLEQGISQISNNDSFASVPPVNIQTDPLYVFHKNSLHLKHKIVRTLAFLFYKPEEYSLVNYICCIAQGKFKTEIGSKMTTDRYKEHKNRIYLDMEQELVIKKQDLISKFYEAEKNLTSLKLSKMIVDKEKDVEYIKINTNFFDMLSSICEGMLENIQKEEKQFADQKEVICKGCRTKRPSYLIQARQKCECGSMEVLAQDNADEKRQTLKILAEQIQKIKNWKQEMDDLKRKQKQREAQEKNKNLENHRVTDIDKDIALANEYIEKQGIFIKDYVSPWSNYALKKNGINLKIAEKQFAPKRSYEKVKELGQARKRKKIEPLMV